MFDQEDQTIQRQLVFESLFSELSRFRRGVHIDKMAQALLKEETDRKDLIGILQGGEKAVFYQEDRREIVAIPFDKHGTQNRFAESLWRRETSETVWEHKIRERLVWLHPRYR